MNANSPLDFARDSSRGSEPFDFAQDGSKDGEPVEPLVELLVEGFAFIRIFKNSRFFA